MAGGQIKSGLRDRKRADTRARIEAAAIELVARDGLEAATVDAISERADVSPRTFFNYFDSKDAAILGLQPRELDDQALEEQLESADQTEPVLAVVRLVLTTLGVADRASSALHQRRFEIMRRHPQILSSQFAQLNARKNRLTDYTAKVLGQHAPFQDDPDAVVRAGIVLALCASAVRSAVEHWAQTAELLDLDETSGDPDQVAAIGIDEVAAIEERAVAFVSSTLERLA